MEGEDLFEGIDMDFLANSEGPTEVPESSGQGLDLETVAEQETPAAETEKNDDAGLGLELEYIANLEEPEAAATSSEEKEEINDDSRTPESDGSPSSPLTSLTSTLHEDGVLSSLSEEELAEIKTGTDLMEAIKKQIADNELSDLTEDQKEYLDALRSGVPDANYRSSKSAVDQYSKIDESSLEGDEASDFRKNLITNDFLSKGFSEAEAKKHAERSFDLGEDIEDAKASLGRLKATEKDRINQMSEQAKAQQKANEEANQKHLDNLKEKVGALKEVIPGVKFNTKTGDKVFDLMTKTAGFDSNNNPMNAVIKEMVENPDYLVKLNYLHLVTDGFNDWTKVSSGAKRNAVNKLDASLQAQEAKIKMGSTATGSSNTSKNSGFFDALTNSGI